MSDHLVFGDAHAIPGKSNKRAQYLGELISDLKPDLVIDLGDTADLPSLCTHDKGQRVAAGRRYAADVAAHNEFQDMLWWKLRKNKRKMPRRIRLIGNHERRIDRALDQNKELVGTISYKDLDLERYYDEVVYYDGETPGVIEIDGVSYSHFFASGAMGRPVSGQHQAYSLVQKLLISGTMGHSHALDFSLRKSRDGRSFMGLVAPCYIDYKVDWVGEGRKSWTSGVIFKKGVERGCYGFSFIPTEQLARNYG